MHTISSSQPHQKCSFMPYASFYHWILRFSLSPYRQKLTASQILLKVNHNHRYLNNPPQMWNKIYQIQDEFNSQETLTAQDNLNEKHFTDNFSCRSSNRNNCKRLSSNSTLLIYKARLSSCKIIDKMIQDPTTK